MMSELDSRDEKMPPIKSPQSLMNDTLNSLRIHKPNDRGELDRRFAVTITEMEKVAAYFKTYVLDAEPPGANSDDPIDPDSKTR